MKCHKHGMYMPYSPLKGRNVCPECEIEESRKHLKEIHKNCDGCPYIDKNHKNSHCLFYPKKRQLKHHPPENECEYYPDYLL